MQLKFSHFICSWISVYSWKSQRYKVTKFLLQIPKSFGCFASNLHFNPLRTEVYFCHQNQNAKNIGNITTPLKPHNVGTHLKGIETSFHVVPLFLKCFHFSVSYSISLFAIFPKYLQSLRGLSFCRIVLVTFDFCLVLGLWWLPSIRPVMTA
jgi:hypothetical protein